MRYSFIICIASFFLLAAVAARAQQMSLGTTPYMMNKSAVLELNSARQGLLLPRLTDTAAINTLNPPDGMVIYFTPTKQFLLRANGYWNPLAASASLANYWSTTGNSNGAIKKFGNTDNYDLPFVTNNAERMRLTAAGSLGIGTTSPSTLLHVSGTNPLTLNGVQAGGTTASDSLLTINNGTVQKLPVATFQPMLNGSGFVKASGSSISYDNNAYTIANSPITGSTKTKITYDAKGLVIAGANLSASDIPDLSATYQPLNGSLTSIGGLAGTSGYLKKTAANTYVLDNSSFLTTETDPVVKAINGLVKSNGTTISAAVAGTDYVAPNASITGATKTKITYDSKGLVTAGADATTSDVAEGSNLYYTDARVRGAALTGLSAATATAVTAADNVLAGVGKLQGQINAINGAGYLTTESDPLAAKKANNLSDLVNISTARTNLGATTVGSNFFTLTNPSATTFPRINADNSVSALDAATFRTAIGAGTGSGSVSSVSVVSANGFAGAVATATSTPAITLSTTVNGLLKGNSGTGVISAAVAGTDYQSPIALPFTTNRYYNGYGNFVGLNSDSIVQGSTNLFATAAEKSTWNLKEGAITAPYSANRYWNGYKQFVSLNTDSITQGSNNLFYTDARVRGAALTGLSTATATAVTATDNLLAGMGKLQGQINAINGAGYQTGNQSINFTAGGDASGSASGTTSISPSLTVTGLRGAALPALATGLLKYNGSAWTFDNSAYLTSETSTLANVTGRGNSTATGINLTQNGNLSTSYGLYLKRNTDASPLGNLILAQNAAASSDLFRVDVAGNTTATSFVKSGGTASQFLKADGSVDNNTYLAGNQTVTLSGDVSGAGTTAITTTIGANKVTLNHLAQVANGSFLGRTSAGTGNVEALTTAQAKTLLGITGSNSGDVSLSGQNYLSLSGQTITANAIDLSGTHATGTLAAGRFGALTGDVTNTTGSYATTIAAGAVTYSKMQNISGNNRLLGRATTGAGSPEEIVLGAGLALSGNTLTTTAGTTGWNTTGNTGTASATNFLGTTDNVSLRLRTANTERMVVDSMGHVGIGVTAPANNLAVKDTIEIRRSGSVSALVFSNTSGAGDFRIAGDGGDIFWQGGGGRALQMGSYWGMILGGDRQNGTLPSFTAGTGGTGVLIPAQRTSSVPLAVQAASGQTANLTEWRASSNTILNAVTSAGNLGIGTASPSTKLHVVGANPLTLTGVQVGGTTTADSVLTINNGTVQKLPVSTFATPANSWSTLGNGAINWQTNFLGSTNNASLRFRTNNLERLIVDSLGKVAIGTTVFDATNPEKFLVDAGTTTSTNLLKARGSINSYLQMNLQNTSTGAAASTDIVATADNGTETTNFVDFGINGSGNNSGYFGNANDGYLYNIGQDFLIGNGSAGEKLLFLTGGGDKVINARMTIDSLGLVGIGTTTPTQKLDVAGNVRFSGALMPGGSAGTFGYVLQSTGAGSAPVWADGTAYVTSSAWLQNGNSLSTLKNFGTTSNYALPFITNNTEWMRLGTNGYLGLGTTNPAGRFHAVSDNSETGDDYLFDDYSNATNSGFFFRKSRGTAAAPQNLQLGDLIHGLNFVPRFNGSLSYAPSAAIESYYQGTGTDNKGDLRFSTSGSEKMRIDKDGNVGIGSSAFDATSPEKLLVDAGSSTYTPILAKGTYDGYFQINVKNSSAGTQSSSDLVATANNGTETTNFVNLGINGSNYVYASGSPIETGKANDGYLISAGSDFYVVNNNAAKDMIFLTGGTATTNEAMRITAAGRIGMGTATPSEKFHVVLPTGTGTTQTPVATVETVNAITTATSLPPILQMIRQVPSFAASTNYSGPGISFGFRTSGTANNVAQILSTSLSATSRVSFYSRTGMTNANPSTGTLAENMYLDGTVLNVKNLQGGATTLSVDASGNIIRTPSDVRLKRAVQTIDNPLSKIMKLRGVTYNWIDTTKMGSQKEIGFIAQELEKVVPEVVSSGGEYKSVNYQVMTALLTEGIKEQQKEIDGLKKEMQEMRELIRQMKNQSAALPATKD